MERNINMNAKTSKEKAEQWNKHFNRRRMSVRDYEKRIAELENAIATLTNKLDKMESNMQNKQE